MKSLKKEYVHRNVKYTIFIKSLDEVIVSDVIINNESHVVTFPISNARHDLINNANTFISDLIKDINLFIDKKVDAINDDVLLENSLINLGFTESVPTPRKLIRKPVPEDFYDNTDPRGPSSSELADYHKEVEWWNNQK